MAQTRAAFAQTLAIVRVCSLQVDCGCRRFCRKGIMSTSVSAVRSETHSVQNRRTAEGAVFSIIMALSFSHFLNDMMQSLGPALYSMLKGRYGLRFVLSCLM